MRGNGPLRFRKYRSGRAKPNWPDPVWHWSVHQTRTNGYDYRAWYALCGYEANGILGVDVSRAVKPSKGELCTRCEKKAAAMLAAIKKEVAR